MVSSRVSVRLTQGGGLGDVILQSGAAVYLTRTRELDVIPLFASGHLGDVILQSGAATVLARRLGGIRIFSNNYCAQSVKTIFSLVRQVQAVSALDPGRADWSALVDLNDKSAITQKLVGKPLDWYRQFGVPFIERWDSCPIPELTSKIKPADWWGIFVHDDPSRGQIIPISGYRPALTPDIFEHVPMLKSARQIHCMESSFFHLVESMPEIEARLFFYPNARASTYYPDLPMRHAWEIC